MPIVIVTTSPGAMGPVIVCDVCGNWIRDPKDGNALWGKVKDPATTSTPQAPVFAHKLECTGAADKQQGDRYFWTGLEVWLYQLMVNTGMNLDADHLEDVKHTTEMMSG